MGVREGREAEDGYGASVLETVNNLTREGGKAEDGASASQTIKSVDRSINLWIVNKLMIPMAASKSKERYTLRFGMKANTEFSEFRQWYSNQVSYPADYLILRKDNWNEIKDNETPNDLKLKDNDVIEVIFAVPETEKHRNMFLNKQKR